MSVGGNTKISHDAAHLHVAGASEFVDDRAAMAGEVFVTVIYSPIAKGRIGKLDASAIASDPNFVAFYTHRDLAHNVWGTIFRDQPLLAETEVAFAGEPVALLVTTDRRAGLRLRAGVVLQIAPLPALLSIAAARDAGSFIGSPREINRDFSEAALAACDHTLADTVVLEGADHFYLESQVSVAYPLEDGQLEIHTSSQHPSEVQHVV
ncbi:MAG: molybdopterin-dependent oxidoreductase, partial [Myxococcales bacterium]|nr:molybdopterin-dependent oxidoreductase [Myxococcales bacterium]